jgi:hypothetical protein
MSSTSIVYVVYWRASGVKCHFRGGSDGRWSEFHDPFLSEDLVPMVDLSGLCHFALVPPVLLPHRREDSRSRRFHQRQRLYGLRADVFGAFFGPRESSIHERQNAPAVVVIVAARFVAKLIERRFQISQIVPSLTLIGFRLRLLIPENYIEVKARNREGCVRFAGRFARLQPDLSRTSSNW